MSIRVVAERLGCNLMSPDPDVCLDVHMGAIVPAAFCPRHDTGFGRPAVQSGKRYIIVPSLDEITQELQAQIRRADHEIYPQEENDPRFHEWAEEQRKIIAGTQAAMGWLNTLQLPDTIFAVEEARLDIGISSGVYAVLYEGTCEWQEVPEISDELPPYYYLTPAENAAAVLRDGIDPDSEGLIFVFTDKTAANAIAQTQGITERYVVFGISPLGVDPAFVRDDVAKSTGPAYRIICQWQITPNWISFCGAFDTINESPPEPLTAV